MSLNRESYTTVIRTMDILKAGKLLYMEAGEYSDYQILGHFVVLSDFNRQELLREYLVANPSQQGLYSFDKYEFIAFLISKGLLLELTPETMDLGSYAEIPDWFIKGEK